MAWKQQKDGSIVITTGQGIAASPYDGTADLKNVNIHSIKGEVSLAYNRVRVDSPSLTGQNGTATNASSDFGFTGTITAGTWINIDTTSGAIGLTVGNWYQVVSVVANVSMKLSSTTGGIGITASATGTFTFHTLAMSIPVDYTVENLGVTGSNTFRYWVLDQAGVVWASGIPTITTDFSLSPTMSWVAVTPHGSTKSIRADTTTITHGGSISVMYGTNPSTNSISTAVLMIFTDSKILYMISSSNSFPSISGVDAALFKTLNYTNYPHRSVLGADQVMYFTDGPGVGILQQKTGIAFSPSDTTTYNYVNANYLMIPTDAAQRIAILPNGNGLSIVVGGQQNNLYIYPSYQTSTTSGAAPTSILWMPEANTQFLLQVNNYILIFAGNKGNIYITNGSSVTPILTVPDYIAGSKTFVQDPYFTWGGAAYLRGRVFFSIQDQNNAHTGNCGGIWSFTPSFSYFINQDVGLSLVMESASSLFATEGYNGVAPVIFAGQEPSAQQANGPQYIACWNQSINSIDFSGTSPATGTNQMLIETDAIPVGTFLERRTFKQFEIKFSSSLASGESVAVNYRTDLESAWSSAGTVIYDGDRLAAITNELNFEKAQILQFQITGTGTTVSPSWIRIKEMYLR